MNKWLYLLMILLSIGDCAYCANIVYPRCENVTINSPKTFFVGNENPQKILRINDEEVKIHPSGGFKYPVNLEYGVNRFQINNGDDEKVYTIERPQPKPSVTGVCTFKPVVYENPVVIMLIKDNIPLRSTPVDAGLNRLQHLQKGIELYALGEERGFYKVKLGRDDYGFIAFEHAQKIEKQDLDYAEVSYIMDVNNRNKQGVEILLDKKVPYIISVENNGIDIILYNIEGAPYGKLEKHIKLNGKLLGYDSYYTDNTLTIFAKSLELQNSQNPFENLKITIDPGHGGKEAGAIGCLGNTEKAVNLEIALDLKHKLENLGASVFMTREDDIYVDLNKRVEYANEEDSDIFLSIHNNSLPDSLADKDASGVETYYFYLQSKDLSREIAEGISSSTGLKNGGARGQSFAVIRNTRCPAVLIEVGYMINPDDNSKIIDKVFQGKVTDGIIKGLENYLK